MSYLHCSTCRCAYNVTTHRTCPTCGVRPGTPTDPVEAVVEAAEQLARAVSRVTPVQLAKAQAELAMRDANRALPPPDALHSLPSSMMRAVRAALAPAKPATPVDHVVTGRAQQALLTTVVLALMTRLPKQRPSMRAWASTHVLPRVAAARALLARN